MDFNRYRPLLAKANEKLIALTFRTQLATQPPDLETVIACLQDGSIDAGDLQQVTQGLMKKNHNTAEKGDLALSFDTEAMNHSRSAA